MSKRLLERPKNNLCRFFSGMHKKPPLGIGKLTPNYNNNKKHTAKSITKIKKIIFLHGKKSGNKNL
jgi:hypothetical protein